LRLDLFREIISKLFKETPAPWADLRMLDLGKLAQQFLLPGRQVTRGLDVHFNNLISASTPADVRHTPPPQPKRLTALRPTRHFDIFWAVKRRNLDDRPQGRLRETDRNLANQVVSPPLEERMLFHGNLNSQVASLSSYVSQFALVAQLKHHATFD